MQMIPGVTLIELGIAEGHGLVIDQIMLAQVVACSKTHSNGVKAKVDHGSGVLSTIGRFTNFRIKDECKVIADLELLDSEPDANKIIEMSRVMPEELGFSLEFEKSIEVIGNVPHVRCVNLEAAALVDSPAATSGMFTATIGGEKTQFSSKVVDSFKKDNMAKSAHTIPATSAPEKEGHSEEKLASPTSEREIQPPAPNQSAQVDEFIAAVLAKIKDHAEPDGDEAKMSAPIGEKEESTVEKPGGLPEDFKKDTGDEEEEMASTAGGTTPTPAVTDHHAAVPAPAIGAPGSKIGQAIVDHVHAHLSDPTKANLKQFSALDVQKMFLSTIGAKPTPMSNTNEVKPKTLQEIYDDKKAEFGGSNQKAISYFASKNDEKMCEAFANNGVRYHVARKVYKSSF